MAKKAKKSELQPLTLDYVRSLVPLDWSKIGVQRPQSSKRQKHRRSEKKK